MNWGNLKEKEMWRKSTEKSEEAYIEKECLKVSVKTQLGAEKEGNNIEGFNAHCHDIGR